MKQGKYKDLVHPSIGWVGFNFFKSFWLWAMLIPAMVLGPASFRMDLLVLTLAMSFLTLCLGHSVGLHRCLIHQTFQCGPVLRGFLAWLAVMCGMGGPVTWARIHAVRDYWQNRPDCPPYFAYKHGIFRDFNWNLHLSFHPADARAEAKLPSNLLKDPWLNFLERTWPLHILSLAAILWMTLGWEAVVACVCARTAGSILGHWAVGYASHAWGDQPHRREGASENGSNNWLLGVLSFGEGFHNNHHAYPGSARMGLGRWDLDLGWLSIKCLEKLKLAWGVRSVSGQDIRDTPQEKAMIGAMSVERCSGLVQNPSRSN